MSVNVITHLLESTLNATKLPIPSSPTLDESYDTSDKISSAFPLKDAYSAPPYPHSHVHDENEMSDRVNETESRVSSKHVPFPSFLEMF